MDQNEERGKGFVDHANDFISLGRKAFGTGKKLGTISGIFGGGGEAATAAEAGAAAGEIGAAGATSEVWVPIAVVLVIIIIFTFFMVGFTSSPVSTGTNNPGNPNLCGNNNSLDYTIPMHDTSAIPNNPSYIQSQITSLWPYAAIYNWNKIVWESVAAGWNPSFILALWVEESGAQGSPGYTDALGCDPDHPTKDIDKSLSCVFNNFNNAKTFEDFMCRYGRDGFHTAPCTFATRNRNFPDGIKSWYSKISGNAPQMISVSPTSCGATQTGDWPTAGKLTQGPLGASDHARINTLYGWDALDIASHTNTPGTPVYSSFDGVVSSVHNCVASGDCIWSHGLYPYGNSILIASRVNNISFSVMYGHFEFAPTLTVGQTVKAGDQIGVMGTTGDSTGPHLHWEFRGIPMAPPYIKQAITPLDCDTPSIPCNPDSVRP